MKPLIIFHTGATPEERAQYDPRVTVKENDKAWMDDQIFDYYMTLIGGILSEITGIKMLWLDGMGSHWSNEKLLQELMDKFDIALHKGIPGMTQFWQPCDQFIIALFKRYIRMEFYKKIKSQSQEVKDFIMRCHAPPTPEQLEEFKKLIRLTNPQMRIFTTYAVGEAWEILLTKDEIWTDSWIPSGLTLPVDGSMDELWKRKMIEKYAGTIDESTPIMSKTERFCMKQRAITTIFNSLHGHTILPIPQEEKEIEAENYYYYSQLQ